MRLQSFLARSIPILPSTGVSRLPLPCDKSLARISVLVFLASGLLAVAFSLPAYAAESGYRLLELDGYKMKWGDRQLGAGASVSYAFARQTIRFDDARNCRDLAPIEVLLGEDISMETLARETAAAFRVWERAAGLSFHEVRDAGDADIVLGAQGQPRGRAFANVAPAQDPEEGVRTIDRALVCLNPDHQWKVGFDGDEDVYDIRYTLIHEIGHAIGLDHPGPSGQVMAFRYTEDFDQLQPGDLRGIRLLYGRAADDGDPTEGFDARRSRKHLKTSHATNLIGLSVKSAFEEDEIESTSEFIIDRNRSIAVVNVGDFLGISDNRATPSCDRMDSARDAGEGVW